MEPSRYTGKVQSVAIGLSLLLAAYLAFTPRPTHDIQGNLYLKGTLGRDFTRSCVGLGRYADIAPGAQVRLLNQRGKPIASTILDQGVYQNGRCVYHFTFLQAPVASAYRPVIAHWTSGAPARLRSHGWKLELGLEDGQLQLVDM